MRQNKAHFSSEKVWAFSSVNRFIKTAKSPFGDLNRHLIFALRNIEFLEPRRGDSRIFSDQTLINYLHIREQIYFFST